MKKSSTTENQKSCSDSTHKTAIKRKVMSKPLRLILQEQYSTEKNKIVISPEDKKLRVLDYGCGYGADADALAEHFNYVERFDPFYFPKSIVNKFDIIFCTYVLNILKSKDDRVKLMKSLISYTKPNGAVYITTRRDLKTETRTQFKVELDASFSWKKTSNFEIYTINDDNFHYLMTKGETTLSMIMKHL